MTIKERLSNLPGESIMVAAIKHGVTQDFSATIKMIISQTIDNTPMMRELIGTELLKDIINHSNQCYGTNYTFSRCHGCNGLLLRHPGKQAGKEMAGVLAESA